MNNLQKFHFIAIGGSLMHNLALALHSQGHQVTGSDDQFFNPSKSRLEKAGILPDKEGWNADRITPEIDAIILGMHAKKDNPELLKAQELGLQIFSIPEFIYSQSTDKQRIVIAGSHGKTSITSMIMHVLKHAGKTFDYAVGAQIEGFENTVHLSNDSSFIIIEGDEYLSSPIDRTPKFLRYNHHIALISGIAWDHINVFPTFEEYANQFDRLIDHTPKAGTLIYNAEDPILSKKGDSYERDILKFDYKTHPHTIRDGITYLKHTNGETAIDVFGDHNLSNIGAAKMICDRLCISEGDFYEAIATFKGASKRLEVLKKSSETTIYRDFAHAPSKVKASTQAVKKQFPSSSLVACLELHTFSSLNKTFLKEYNGTLNQADDAIVFIDPVALEKKGGISISQEELRDAFKKNDLLLFTNSKELSDHLSKKTWSQTNLLLMSSGNFGGIDFSQLTSLIA